jgi:hypothetical protein
LVRVGAAALLGGCSMMIDTDKGPALDWLLPSDSLKGFPHVGLELGVYLNDESRTDFTTHPPLVLRTSLAEVWRGFKSLGTKLIEANPSVSVTAAAASFTVPPSS